MRACPATTCTNEAPINFLDTNILLYSLDTEDARKRDRAVALLERDDNALSVQVLQEFYVQSTRVSRQRPLSHAEASEMIGTLMRYPIQEVTSDIVLAALEIRSRYRYSYWDSAILAAAAAAGCRQVLTEDMQHGHTVAGVEIVNPFLP